MDDCLVYGLFAVDRLEVGKPNSERVIRQDYFVVRFDGDKDRDACYYSGPREKAWRTQPPPFWSHIENFCDDFAGPGNCYDCTPRGGKKPLPKHHYTEKDADLPVEPAPAWRLAFDLALAWARHLERPART